MWATDPSGEFMCGECTPIAASCPYCGLAISVAGGIYDLGKLFGWWGQSRFHGSLKPRPNAPWSEHMGGITPLGAPMGSLNPLAGIAGLNQALGLPTLADVGCLPICDATDPDQQPIHDLAVGITADSQHSFGCIAQAYGIQGTGSAATAASMTSAPKRFAGWGFAQESSWVSENLGAVATRLGIAPWGRWSSPVGGLFSGGQELAIRATPNIGRAVGRWLPYGLTAVTTAISSWHLWNCL
jgi:hypothetical protein